MYTNADVVVKNGNKLIKTKNAIEWKDLSYFGFKIELGTEKEGFKPISNL